MSHPHNSGSAVRIVLKILNNENCQQVDERNDNYLYKKKFVQGKWAVLGPKMGYPRNSGLALRIFLNFYRMKGANRYMKILVVVFHEKNSFWAV